MEKLYKTEKEGQIAFFDNYCKAEPPPSSGEGERGSPNHRIPWQENDGVLVENCDCVYRCKQKYNLRRSKMFPEKDCKKISFFIFIYHIILVREIILRNIRKRASFAGK